MVTVLRVWLLAASLWTVQASAQFCPGASPWVFNDVASNHPFCPSINWVANRGITLGCSVIDADHRLYCPNANVTRGEMAAFMFRLGSQNAFLQGGNVFAPTARLGATNTAPLELIVANRRAFRIEPSTISPNIVGGNSSNRVLDDVRGATIGGGGVTPGDTDPDYGFEDVTRISDHYGTIGGGYVNTVGTADDNPANQPFGTVAGGAFNRATAAYATVAGGGANYATSSYAFVGGGEGGQATGMHATVAGGHTNRATGTWSSVGGGGGTGTNCNDPPSGLSNRHCGNQATGQASAIGGGAANLAFHYGTVGGGYANTAGGDFSTVPGGIGNVAGGTSSFAAGGNANALHDGSFVWNGSLAAISSTGSGQFTVNAPGGIRMLGASGSCTLTNGSSGWQCASDRALKSDIVTVDGTQILDRVAALPIARWSFSDVPGVMHMGPMAQEFHAAFALGDDPTRLAPMDVQGVALAAIQGLNAKLEASERELASVKLQLSNVTGALVRLAAQLEALKTQR